MEAIKKITTNHVFVFTQLKLMQLLNEAHIDHTCIMVDTWLCPILPMWKKASTPNMEPSNQVSAPS
jgi:hypothetical protein